MSNFVDALIAAAMCVTCYVWVMLMLTAAWVACGVGLAAMLSPIAFVVWLFW